MAKREAVITPDSAQGRDEWYCEWYSCSHCGDTSLAQGFNYCPNCGYKLRWELEEIE